MSIALMPSGTAADPCRRCGHSRKMHIKAYDPSLEGDHPHVTVCRGMTLTDLGCTCGSFREPPTDLPTP